MKQLWCHLPLPPLPLPLPLPQPMQSFYRNKCEFTIGPSPDGKGVSLVDPQSRGGFTEYGDVCVYGVTC